jgi:uncharacterized protein (TIGR02611 family)
MGMFNSERSKSERRGLMRQVRRLIVLVTGATVLLIGAALLVLPGPAFVVIPVGLAILATEFAWARHLLQKARNAAEKGVDKFKLRSFFRRQPKR